MRARTTISAFSTTRKASFPRPSSSSRGRSSSTRACRSRSATSRSPITTPAITTVVQFYLGEVYYNRGLNEPALAALERSVTLNPDNANAHYLMAFVLGDMGRYQEARAASKRAIQLNPPLARAQTNLSLERYRAERQSAEHRLRAQPEPEVAEGSELAHHNLGLAFRQKGYYAEALREYRLAIERGEDRRLVRQAMAEVYLLKRDFTDALELKEVHL